MDVIKEKLFSMETWDFIRKYLEARLEEQKEDFKQKQTKNTTYFNRKIDDIVETHLFKEGFIGTEKGCVAPTLIEYVQAKVPECLKKIKEAAENI